MVDEILVNLAKVNDLRRGKNDIVFTAEFIAEPNKLVARVKAITGMDDEEMEK